MKDLKKLSSPDYHASIGIFPKWRIGDKSGNMNEIYPFYDADQCEEILDTVLGIDGWGCEYREVAGILFCVISITTENGVFDKADAGGARGSRKRNITDVDKETFEAKTAASSAFVRAASKLGIGRHLNILPKIQLKVDGGVAITPNGERLATPEELSAWCNKVNPALKYLIAIWNMCKVQISDNERMAQTFTELREFIELGVVPERADEKGGAE